MTWKYFSPLLRVYFTTKWNVFAGRKAPNCRELEYGTEGNYMYFLISDVDESFKKLFHAPTPALLDTSLSIIYMFISVQDRLSVGCRVGISKLKRFGEGVSIRQSQ